MSKSKDLREAAVTYQKEGHTYDETAKVFGIVKSTVRRLHHLINIKKCRIFAPFSNAKFHLNTRFIGYVHDLYHRCC